MEAGRGKLQASSEKGFLAEDRGCGRKGWIGLWDGSNREEGDAMNFNFYWFAWCLGMAVPFLIKYANYMLQETGVIQAKVPLTNIVVTGQRWGVPVATLRFLFGDPKVATTTFISFTLELVFGAWYIDGLPLPY